MIALFALIILFLLAMIIPAFIVLFWRKRPVTAFILSGTILAISMVAPSFVWIFQNMMVDGVVDPEFVAGVAFVILVKAIFGLLIGLPILAMIQKKSRRNDKENIFRDKDSDPFK